NGISYVGLTSRQKSRFAEAALCRLPTYCVTAAATDRATLYRDLSLSDGVWTAARVTEITLQPGGSVMFMGAPWSNGDVLLSDERGLYRLAVKTGVASRLMDLYPRHFMRVFPGDPPRAVANTAESTEAEYELATLDENPEWVKVVSLPLYKWGA